jgi:hypothetical protein
MCGLDPVRAVAVARYPDRTPYLLRLVIAECVERVMVGNVTRGTSTHTPLSIHGSNVITVCFLRPFSSHVLAHRAWSTLEARTGH